MSIVSGLWSVATVVAFAVALGCGGTAPPPSAPAPAAEGAAGRSMEGEGTGSVGVVDGDDFHGRPAVTIEELIEGQVAGVQVVHHGGGGVSFRIRGRGSINSDNEPLYVVDGMIVHVAPNRGLDWLNPGDIKRIEILKDASTTSMYGVRGANGVVVITTRRGKRPDGSR